MVHQNEAPVSRCSWDAACTWNSCNQRLRMFTTWITFLRMALHLRCKLLILRGPKNGKVGTGSKLLEINRSSTCQRMMKWLHWTRSLRLLSWQSSTLHPWRICLNMMNLYIAVDQRSFERSAATPGRVRFGHEFEEATPSSDVGHFESTSPCFEIDGSRIWSTLQPPIGSQWRWQPWGNVVWARWHACCNVFSTNRDREGACLGTQPNKQSSVTAFFLCLAAAGAAGADCNGSARGNGVKSFCFWPRRVLLLLPLPAQMQSIQTHSQIVIIRMDLGVTISLSAGI